jgi:starvation-inducible outer membrane lipoprotein
VDERKIIEKNIESEGKPVIRRKSDGRIFVININLKTSQ